MSSSSDSATGSAITSRPSAYPMKTRSQPLTSTFSISESSSKRLEAADAEQRGVHAGGELLLLFGVGRTAARGDLGTRELLQDLADEGAGELALVLGVHRGDAVGGVEPALVGQPAADLLAEALNEAVVHLPLPALRGPPP